MSTKSLLSMAVAATLAAAATTALADLPPAFDVAEDQTAFVFERPSIVTEPDSAPYVRRFVSRGYIYPAGTLSSGVAGVDDAGKPVFPEKVIGSWRSEGWYVGNARQASDGMWIVSRQVFNFETGDTLVTRGEDRAKRMERTERAVTGGSGNGSALPSAIFQTFLGFADNMSASYTYETEEQGLVEMILD